MSSFQIMLVTYCSVRDKIIPPNGHRVDMHLPLLSEDSIMTDHKDGQGGART
jgi:hypothetical protein